MAWDDIPRTHSFSLGDFHDFDRCVFRFFVNHHLQKKYELAEGSPNKAIGTLLDLAIKKLHAAKAYGQPADYLPNLIKAAEIEIRSDVAFRGPNSFYGALIPYLNKETVEKAKEVFKNYHQTIGGNIKKSVPTQTLKRSRPFWKKVIKGEGLMQLWGGPDAIEIGGDGIPEVVDYKYFGDSELGKENLDMDLMPKIYTLLCAADLFEMGFQKARFVVRLWHDPLNDSFYEEFDLSNIPNIEEFFKDKMERILRTKSLSFCEKDYCGACQSPNKADWIRQLQLHGWIEGV